MGRFRRGQSGNPKGRPKGITDRRVIAREQLASQLPKVIAKVIEAAEAGDMQAARIVLDHALPKLRPESNAIVLEGVPPNCSPSTFGAVVMKSVAQGKLPVSLASELMAACANQGRVIEIADLQARVEALEARGDLSDYPTIHVGGNGGEHPPAWLQPRFTSGITEEEGSGI